VKFADGQKPDVFTRSSPDKTRRSIARAFPIPAARICDIEAIAKIAHDAGVPLIVDNTMATPYLIKPVRLGRGHHRAFGDEFLGGHGNSMAGLVVDGGKFNWGNGKFPTLSEPCPSYHA